VSAAITRLMCTGAIGMQLRQITACLAELVRTAEASDRAELRSINELTEARRRETAALRQRVSEEEAQLAAFEENAKALQVSFDEVEAHFKEAVATSSRLLRERLDALVRAFALKEADALVAALSESPRQWTWRCNVQPLRERMEETYLAACQQAAADIDRLEQILHPQLQLIVSSLMPGYRGELLEV